MNTLIICDSEFGNTYRIAEAIAEVMGRVGPVRLLRAGEFGPGALEGVNLVLVGGPTHRHTISKRLKAVLKSMPRKALRGVPVAAFDTRYRMPRWKSGSAASVAARKLRSRGGRQIVPPESFFVAAREGPLEDGEIEWAREWAASIIIRLGVR
ncbi:MAG TPA: flavodoxin [Thermoflexia bacterium]|nr:flavodoxin [Thermoflexia bacterium]